MPAGYGPPGRNVGQAVCLDHRQSLARVTEPGGVGRAPLVVAGGKFMAD